MTSPWSECLRTWSVPTVATAPKAKAEFDPRTARAICEAALARARDDSLIARDHAVYRYLDDRRLSPAIEHDVVGILAEDMELPTCVFWWPQEGFRIVVPLYDVDSGEVVNLQARRIRPGKPNKRFPTGSRVKRTVFADAAGLKVLRGDHDLSVPVGIAEGLTDFLALITVSPFPVLGVPGAGMTSFVFGSWAKGATVLVALDRDETGRDSLRDALQLAARSGVRCLREVKAWPGEVNDAADSLAVVGPDALGEFIASFQEVEDGVTYGC